MEFGRVLFRSQMMNNLGMILTAEGKLDEAGRFLREALALYKKLLGNRHPLVAPSPWALATMLHQQGRLAERQVLKREALGMQEVRYGAEHMETAGAKVNLAWILDWKSVV